MSWQAPDDFSKHLRRAATPAECLLWQLVRNRQRCQAKFRRQHKLGPYISDFYCAESKLAIECDGLPHFTPEGIEKDRFRTEWLNRQGIEVIRFNSNEIENDTQSVLYKIDAAIKRRLEQDSPPHPPTPSPPKEEKGS
jgi:very-short-patch-repair endonuclease